MVSQPTGVSIFDCKAGEFTIKNAKKYWEFLIVNWTIPNDHQPMVLHTEIWYA
ncbi:MAG TPA: hypothetical protein VE956_22835 [Nodularia sp. (in: cyanobacteria)]|nr:hypothetical protein [Nodularia sp. (in: cyanobacteria)]